MQMVRSVSLFLCKNQVLVMLPYPKCRKKPHTKGKTLAQITSAGYHELFDVNVLKWIKQQ